MANPFSIKRVALLKGHTDSVACLAATSDGVYVASGGEDGRLCVHSLATYQLLVHKTLAERDAVSAVVFQPTPLSTGSSSKAALYAATGRELQQITLTPLPAQPELQLQQPTDGARPSIAAAAQKVLELQVVARELVAVDDISALAINQQGTYLAAADDSGDITLFDLASLQQLQQLPQKQSVLQPFRRLQAAHDPLASAVAFRQHKPWQLLSSGLDSKVACWDFSRPRRCCAVWNMAEMPENVPLSRGGSVEQQHNGGHLWNPPMVHALAVPWDRSSCSTGSRGSGNSSNGSDSHSHTTPVALAPALARRVVAVARGDGIVAVFDADGDAKPSTHSGTSHTSNSGNAASSSQGRLGATAANHLQSSKLANKGSRQQATTAEQHSSTAAAAAVATPPSSRRRPQQLQQQLLGPQQQQQQHVHLKAGFHVCLGPHLGGQREPAAAVVFLPWDGGCRYLVSGGEDGRLLLWDWQVAAAGCDRAAASDAASAPAADRPKNVDAETPEADRDAALLTSAAALGTSTSSALLLDRQHKRKVNSLCCTMVERQQDRCLVLVADTSHTVSVMLVLRASLEA